MFKIGDMVRNVSDKDVTDVPIGGIYTVTNITDHGIFNFLDDVGFERERDSDHYELVTPEIVIGKKMKVKRGCENKCLNYADVKEKAAYVIFNNDLKSYTIYDKSGTAIAGCCACLKAEHVEPYQEQHDSYGTTATEAAMQVGVEITCESMLKALDSMTYEGSPMWYTGTSINNKRKGIMQMLREIPNRLKRALNKSLEAMYQLGWVDSDLNYTEEGTDQLLEMLHDEYEEKLGERAIKEVARLKKLAKEHKTDN